jgi:hypothetical protein
MTTDQAEMERTASPAQTGDILGQLIGAAGKYFGR